MMNQSILGLLASFLILGLAACDTQSAPDPEEKGLPSLPLYLIDQMGEQAQELATTLESILDTTHTRSILQDLNLVTNALGPESNLQSETISSQEKVIVGLKTLEELLGRKDTPAEVYLIGGEFLHRIDQAESSQAHYLLGFERMAKEMAEKEDKQKLVSYYNALLAGTKAFRQQGNYELALKTAAEAIDLNDRPQAYKERAYIYWDQLCISGVNPQPETLNLAKSDLIEVLKYDADPNLQAMLGHIYFMQGATDQSTAQFDKTDLVDGGKRRSQFETWKGIWNQIQESPSRWTPSAQSAILLLPLGYFAPFPKLAAQRKEEGNMASKAEEKYLAEGQALVIQAIYQLNSGSGERADQSFQQAQQAFSQVPNYPLQEDAFLQAVAAYSSLSMEGLLRSLQSADKK